MSLLQIWNRKQIRHYDHPPAFSVHERKHFLTLPPALHAQAEAFHTLTNQVGFTLMVGYFLARKRFFATQHFAEPDIAFLCRRKGAWPFAFDSEAYKRSTYTRHRHLILDYFAVRPFQPEHHRALISEAIYEQIYSFEEPALMLDFILEWLEQRRIELPTYHTLQRLLTETIRQRNRTVSQRLEAVLGPVHRRALDPLLTPRASPTSTGERTEYLLTKVQTLSPADSPKQIRANLEKLAVVDEMHTVLDPLCL